MLVSEAQGREQVAVFGHPKNVVRYRVTDAELAELLDALASATIVSANLTAPLPVRDPKDEHLLAAAH